MPVACPGVARRSWGEDFETPQSRGRADFSCRSRSSRQPGPTGPVLSLAKGRKGLATSPQAPQNPAQPCDSSGRRTCQVGHENPDATDEVWSLIGP